VIGRIAAIWVPLVIFSTQSVLAQTSAVYYSSEDSTYAESFYEQRAGTVGILSGVCGTRNSLTGRRPYLVKNGQIYWGLKADCVRVIVNHQSTAAGDPSPTYLGVQIIGYYDTPQATAVILRRVGKFKRAGSTLPEFPDQELPPERLSQEQFNTWHQAPDGPAADKALADFDDRVRIAWHGTPENGSQDSWNQRFWFSKNTAYDARIAPRYKVLENRLIRFTPYPTNGRPKDGPLNFDVNRKGAAVAVIRVFSPSNSDLDGNFALVYTTNAEMVAKIVNVQVARWSWVW
jgi:hypothetical protein